MTRIAVGFWRLLLKGRTRLETVSVGVGVLYLLMLAQPAWGQGPGPGPLAALQPPPAPPGNSVTTSKANLGKVLFWDEQLSSTRTVACGTCHILAAGGSDPRSSDLGGVNPGFDGLFGTADDVFASPGVPLNQQDGSYSRDGVFGLRPQVTGRQAPSAVDAAYAVELFWDGRAGELFRDPLSNDVVLETGAALESQAVGPPTSSVEMAHESRDWNQVAERVSESFPLAQVPSLPVALANWIDGRAYPELFLEAFGTADVTPSRVAMAIATYERTLFSDQTPLDLTFSGGPVLTQLEQFGRQVFTANGCVLCHGGPLLSDGAFHYIGVRPADEDSGRFQVTGNPGDRGAFRTPSLRNVSLRARYMHDGRFASLSEVVDFYNRGGDFTAPNKAPLVRPLNLSPNERGALVAFLSRPLTDSRVADESAPFDRPMLYTESGLVPEVSGAGVPGSGGVVPRVVALEPPISGNPNFTVAVDQALGGGQALLAIDTIDPGLTPPASASFLWQTAELEGVGNGGGFGSISMEIPSDPQLLGQELLGRWYVTDPQAPGGFSASPAFRFLVFPVGVGFANIVFGDGFESGTTEAWVPVP